MWSQIKKLSVITLCFLICACAYTWRGQEGARSEDSVLGTGNKTVKIKGVEQTTLYPWVPYLVRSQLRDEINTRGLARWVDDGLADFELQVNITNFNVSAYGHSSSQNVVSTAEVILDLIVYSGSTNSIIWKSGGIYYEDTFQNSNQEEVVRTIIDAAIDRAVDRLQQKF